VDGIIVGSDIGSVGTPPGCPMDPGWAGVLAQNMPVAAGTAGSKKANLFFAARKGGANIDKVYIGVHVENAPDFTIFDQLTIYFQANGGGGNWDPAKDFALVFDGIGPAAATPSDDGCNKDPGNQVRYYQRDGGNNTWVPQATVPATINFKTSYDYEQVHDAEKEVWELEIGIDVSALGIANAAQIGVGAKMNLFETGVNATTTYHYPAALAPVVADVGNSNPNFGGVTPATLQIATIGSCTNDVIISSFTSTSNTGVANAFTVLTAGDFDNAGNAMKHNHFTATVKFVNPANVTDNSAVAISNSGDVKFDIMPWNSSFTGDFTMNTLNTSFGALGQIRNVSFDWPLNKAQWDATNGLVGGPGHACLKIDLLNFSVDLPNGNHVQQNLTYTSLSTIKESFLLQAPRELAPPFSNVAEIEYILRPRWDNINSKFLTGGTPFKFAFTNAAALQLKSIGKGYYSLRLKRGQKVNVALSITGGVMPYPTRAFHVSAKAGLGAGADPPLEIALKPTSVVTIVANGLIKVPGNPKERANDANGFVLDKPTAPNPGAGQPYPLLPGVYVPTDHVGALIGSCDKFKTAFVIGSSLTFSVPKDCGKLSLAVNSAIGTAGQNSGSGFDLSVIEGDPLYLPSRLGQGGGTPMPQFGIPAQMQPGSNLPQLVIDASQRFGKRLIPSGYVAYAITNSHVR
jgi:hypothetical protein